jgi:hypothetical protein
LPGLSLVILATLSLLLAGCHSTPPKTASQPPPPTAAPSPIITTGLPPANAPLAPLLPPIHIKAGGDGFTDSAGNVWLADQGFADGETTDRPGLSITNTTEPRIYLSERYSMSKFSEPLPNGKYIVKLHFCETYDGITGPGQRVFSFNVAGREFKDFDVWAKAGGFQTAYVETVPVEVTNGKLDITFTPNIENPEINGIEILPGS